MACLHQWCENNVISLSIHYGYRYSFILLSLLFTTIAGLAFEDHRFNKWYISQEAGSDRVTAAGFLVIFQVKWLCLRT